jgi:CelD/BcsL family acetyltransferase involved in cellulose biosynthesis
MMILELDSNAWSSFVEESPEATAFHHPNWARLIASAYGYRAFIVAVQRNGSQPVTAGAPMVEVFTPLGRRRWVSLPFTDTCPPIADDDESRALLTAEVERLRTARSLSEIELRAEMVGPHSHPRQVGVIHRMPLEGDPSEVSRRFTTAQVKRNVRRAEREGITIRHGTTDADMAIFYGLHVRTRRRQGVPVQPRSYFQHLTRHVLAEGLGFVSIAYTREMPIAAAVFLAWNGTCVYKYGASDPDHLRLRPNHLVFWDAIRWASDHGYRTLDFGRTELTNHGLRDFKSSWGAEESPLIYTAVRDKAPGAARGRLTAAMRPVIQHAPSWVCRGLGEVLYRYAA